MIQFVKTLPETQINTSEYEPFIKNDWFRNHYMWFAYTLMFLQIFPISIFTTSMNSVPFLVRFALILPIFLIHEILHILVVHKLGNIYITHSGLFFWIHSDAKMSKPRFELFMSLPFLMLTVVPLLIRIFFPSPLNSYIEYIAWINSIIASSDIINSILILFKPRNSIFYKGYYKC